MKKPNIALTVILSTILLFLVAMIALQGFAGLFSESVVNRAAAYLTKYDDNFTYIEHETQGKNLLIYFSSEKYPDYTVMVSYIRTYDEAGMDCFRDSYANRMFEEEALENGDRLIGTLYPDERYEVYISQTGVYDGYDRNTTYEQFYHDEGGWFEAIVYKDITEEELENDARRIEELMRLEDDSMDSRDASLCIIVYYYPADSEGPGVECFSDLAHIKDYTAILKLYYDDPKHECRLEKIEMNN